jgi:hypothetical protein
MADDERNQPQQQDLAFGLAEASAADRLTQLGRALRDITADDTECMLVRLIYDQTAQGIGPAWSPAGGVRALLGHSWGPRCGESKLYDIRARLRAAEVIEIERGYDDSGRRIGSSYRINWAGVYAIRGLPLPHALRIGGSATRTPDSATRTPDSATRTPDSATRTPDSATRSPADHYTTRGRARADSTLTDLTDLTSTSTSVVENWPKIRDLARWTYEEANAHRRFAPLDALTRDLYLAFALLASTVMPREWLERVAMLAKRKKADNPPGFLKRVLENDLLERYAMCNSREEAAVLMGRMLAAARPIVEDLRREKAGAEA